MEDPQFIDQVSFWAHELLAWIGFGTLAGLLAKAIMPGRDPGGSLATLLMGIGGTVIGLGSLTFFWREHGISPLTPLGFVVATSGAFVLLFFYRMMAGHWFHESGTVRAPHVRRYRRTRRQAPVVYEDHHYDDV